MTDKLVDYKRADAALPLKKSAPGIAAGASRAVNAKLVSPPRGIALVAAAPGPWAAIFYSDRQWTPPGTR